MPFYAAASFRMVGAATTPTNLCTVQNTAGSTRILKLDYVAVYVSASVATADLVTKYLRYWHLTGVTPTGGTLATKHKTDSVDAASVANVEVRFPASADGTNTVIAHALPATTPAVEAAHPQILTAVGVMETNPLILHDYNAPPFTLRAGETGLVAMVGASAAHLHYVVEVVWEETT